MANAGGDLANALREAHNVVRSHKCGDPEKINRGCPFPLEHPDYWDDYDHATRTIKSTGEVIPCTCPLVNLRAYSLYMNAVKVLPQFRAGALSLDTMYPRWYEILKYVEALWLTTEQQ